MNKIKFIPLALAFALFSCDNYLDVNDSPNALTYDELTPELLLPGAQVSTYRVQATTMNQLGNVFMNSWTRNVASYGNGFDRELQLTMDNTFYNGIWDGLYRNIKNFQGIIDYPNADGKYDYYKAVAKICKVHYSQYLVDLYGDVPYSQAWKGQENITPAYDDDFDVYKNLVLELEEARALINNADPVVALDITAKDVMLHGDLTVWNEFANTIELRLLLRMSEVTGAAATYRDAKLADISSSSFLSTDVTVNPGFNSGNDGEQNPFVNSFFYNSAGKNQQNRNFITMSGHAWKSLQSYASTNWSAFGNNYVINDPNSDITVSYANVTDPRSARMFTAAPTPPGAPTYDRKAVTQGSSVVDVNDNAPTGPLPCRLGAAGHNQPFGFPVAVITDYSKIDGFVMTWSESEFLQAEAALRYPALFSGAQTHFNNGIADNFAFRNATLGSYITTINTRAGFGWTGTDQQKLHAIMYQKWIALMGIHAIESYIDYTRTGYPNTPVSTNATQTRKPYRLIYPISEYIANSANVPSVTAAETFTINAKTPFWVQ